MRRARWKFKAEMWKRDRDDETRAALTAEHPQRVPQDSGSQRKAKGQLIVPERRERCVTLMKKEENREGRKFKEQRFHHANNRLQAFAPSFSCF